MPYKVKKAFLIIIILAAVSSCGTVVQPDRKTTEGIQKVPAGTTEPQSGPSASEQTKKTAALTNYIKDNKVLLTRENGRDILTVGGTILSGIKPDPGLMKDPSETQTYLVELKQFDPDYPKYLDQNGYDFGYFLPPRSVVVRARQRGADPHSLKGFVSAAPYQPFFKISASDGPIERIRRLRVTLWDKTDADRFADFCRDRNIGIVSRAGKDFLVVGGDLKPIIFEESVLRVEKYRDGALFSFPASGVSSVVLPSYAISNTSGAARVSVFDIGIDRTHEDLTGALRNVYETAGDNDTGEFTPHGTHVAGIIAGRGVLSRGDIRGVNTEALIDFYAMGDDLRGLVIPASMHNLFELAMRNNAPIANLSWGTYDDELQGQYLSISRDIDDFVYNHPDLIVITAVGNNGRSIASPATAKNVIAVGALDGNALASYSGRGSASDGRTRPDVVVQGSGIQAPGLNHSYAVENGTSQATAMISGIVSRIYAAVRDGLGVGPTHAVIKSFLIANTTVETAPPANGMGFGGLIFTGAVNPSTHAVARMTSGHLEEINRRVKPGDTLTIALAWTDYPAYENYIIQLIDNFDIEVTTPSGKVFQTEDRINNAKKLVIRDAEGGLYRFRVLGRYVPMSSKDIALTVRSSLGFDPAESPQTNTVVSADRQTVSVNPQDAYAFTPPQTGSTVTGGENTESATGNVQVVTSGSIVDANVTASSGPSGGINSDTVSGAPSTADALSSLSNGTTSQTGMQKIYCRKGDNVLEARAVGVLTNQVISVRFSGNGVAGDDTVLPVRTADNPTFQKLSLRVTEVQEQSWTNGVYGSVEVSDPVSGKTNTFPVTFYVDSKPPALGDRYPEEGGTLTNTVAWISVDDRESGLEPGMRISVDGQILTTNQYDYNYGTRRLSLRFDRIYSGQDRRNVTVTFLLISDLVSNVVSNVAWNFTYDLRSDTTPPDRPTGLVCTVSNRRFDVLWNPNPEKDLSGYRVYLGDADYLVWTLKSPGTISDNRFSFDANTVSKVGVTALDKSGNESERAILDVDYSRPISPPDVLITNVPAQTNGPVSPIIVLMDEGLIVRTNVILSAEGKADVSLEPVWSVDTGKLTINGDGRYTLTVVAEDDDTNIVTNTVRFIIDSRAPSAPEKLSWTQQGMDVQLAWTAVSDNSAVSGTNDALKYRVYRDQEMIASNLTDTNFLSRNADYGRFYYSVSAVDALGNESPRQYVFTKTDIGIKIITTNVYFGLSLNVRADVCVPTNSYGTIVTELSNTNGKVVLRRVKGPTHVLDLSEDLSQIPDGKYLVVMHVTPVGDEFDFDQRTVMKGITVDHTPPRVQTEWRGVTNDQVYIMVRSGETIAAVISDDNYDGAVLSDESNEGTSFATNRIVLPGNRSADCRVEARDLAGNRTIQHIRVNRDDKKPFAEITLVNDFIIGRAWDENLAGFNVMTNGGVYFTSEFPAEGEICGTPRFAGELSLTVWDQAGNTNSFQTNVDLLNDSFTNRIDSILVNGSEGIYFNTQQLTVSVRGNLRGYLEYDLSRKGELEFSSGLVQHSNYLMSGVNDGWYLVTVTASDEKESRELVVDTIKPAVSILPSVRSGTLLRDAFTINDQNLDGYRLTLDGGAADLDEPLKTGTASLSITVWDYAGNTNTVNGKVYVYDPDRRAGEILVDFSAGQIYEAGFNGRTLTNGTADYAGRTHYRNTPASVHVVGDFTTSSVLFNGSALSDQTAVSDGLYRVGVSAADADGKAYSVVFNLVLDQKAPAIAWNGDISKSAKDMPSLNVTDANLSNWELVVNGAAWPTNQRLMEGKLSVKVGAIDMAGNSNAVTNMLIIDRTAPVILSSARDYGYYSRVPDIYIYELNPYEKKTLVNGNSWTGNDDSVPEGDADIRVDAVDEAGNSNGLVIRGIRIDRTPPAVSVYPLEEYVSNATVKVSVSELNPSTFLAYLDGITIEAGRSYTVTDEGRHLVQVYAEDKAGNFTNVKKSFVLDRTPPAIVVRNVIDGMSYPSGLVPNIEVTDLYPVTKTMKLDGMDYHGEAISAEGDHTLEVAARDSAGNTAEKTVRFKIVFDCPIASLTGIDGTQYFGRYFRKDSFQIGASADKGTVTGTKIIVDGAAKQAPCTLNAAGEHLVYAAVTVEYNGVSSTVASPVERVVVDPSAPVVGIINIENGKTYSNVVKSGAMTFDWVVDTSVEFNGKPLEGSVTVTTNSDGFYRYDLLISPYSSLAKSGDNILKVTARDVFGRETSESAVFKLVKTSNANKNDPNALDDNEAPKIVLSGYYNGMVKKDVAIGIEVRDEHFKAMQIDIYTNNGFTNVCAAIVDVDRPDYTLVIPEKWPEVPYLVKIAAADYSRHTSVEELNFTVDRTKPEIVSGIREGDIVQTANALIHVGDLNPYKTIVIVDSNTNWDQYGDYLLNIVSEDTHTVRIIGIDAAGNTADEEFSFTIDRSPPNFIVTGLTEGGIYNADIPVTVQALEPNLSYYTLSNITIDKFTGQQWASYFKQTVATAPFAFTNTQELSNILKITAMDKAGNANALAIGYNLDKTPPSVTYSGANNGSYYSDTLHTASVSIKDDLGVSNSVIVVSSNEGGNTWRVTGSYTNSVSRSVTNVDDGVYRFGVTAMDIAGNTVDTTSVYTIDKVPPQITVTGISSKYTNRNVTIGVTISDAHINPGSAVLVNGIALPLTVTATNITASTNLTAEDRYVLSVQALDLAGNTSNFSAEVYIDKTLPGGTISDKKTDLSTQNRYFKGVVFYGWNCGDINNNDGASGIRTAEWDIVDVLAGTTTTYYSNNVRTDHPMIVQLDFNIGFGDLHEGPFIIRLRLTDWAGNIFTDQRNFIIDRTPPLVYFSADDGVSGVRQIGTNINCVFRQDISSNRTFNVILNANDINNIKSIQIFDGPDDGGPTTLLTNWSTNVDNTTNFQFATAAPAYSTVKAGKHNMQIVVDDVAGNPQVYTLNYGYSNSTVPWVTVHGKDLGGSDKTVYLYNNNYSADGDCNYLFDFHSLADLKPVTITVLTKNITTYYIQGMQYYPNGFYTGYYPYYAVTNVTNIITNTTNLVFGPDITNVFDVGPYLADKDITSNAQIWYSTNYSIVTNIKIITNIGISTNTNTTTNVASVDQTTNYSLYWYPYSDGQTIVQINIQDILGQPTNYQFYCWSDVRPPDVIPGCSEPNARPRKYSVTVKDNLTELTECYMTYEFWDGLFHGIPHSPTTIYFNGWWEGYLGPAYYNIWFYSADHWGHHNDSVNPYVIDFW